MHPSRYIDATIKTLDLIESDTIDFAPIYNRDTSDTGYTFFNPFYIDANHLAIVMNKGNTLYKIRVNFTVQPDTCYIWALRTINGDTLEHTFVELASPLLSDVLAQSRTFIQSIAKAGIMDEIHTTVTPSVMAVVTRDIADTVPAKTDMDSVVQPEWLTDPDLIKATVNKVLGVKLRDGTDLSKFCPCTNCRDDIMEALQNIQYNLSSFTRSSSVTAQYVSLIAQTKAKLDMPQYTWDIAFTLNNDDVDALKHAYRLTPLGSAELQQLIVKAGLVTTLTTCHNADGDELEFLFAVLDPTMDDYNTAVTRLGMVDTGNLIESLSGLKSIVALSVHDELDNGQTAAVLRACLVRNLI